MGTRGWPDKGHVHRLSAILISERFSIADKKIDPRADHFSFFDRPFPSSPFVVAVKRSLSSKIRNLSLSLIFFSLFTKNRKVDLIEDERFIELIELKFGQRSNGRKLGIEESFKIFFTFLGIGKLAVNAIPHKSSGEYMPVSGHASAFLSLTLKSAVMICGGINRARKRSANRDSEMSQCVLLSRFQLNEIRSSISHTKFCVRSKERKKKRFEHKFDLLFQIQLSD